MPRSTRASEHSEDPGAHQEEQKQVRGIVDVEEVFSGGAVADESAFSTVEQDQDKGRECPYLQIEARKHKERASQSRKTDRVEEIKAHDHQDTDPAVVGVRGLCEIEGAGCGRNGDEKGDRTNAIAAAELFDDPARGKTDRERKEDILVLIDLRPVIIDQLRDIQRHRIGERVRGDQIKRQLGKHREQQEIDEISDPAVGMQQAFDQQKAVDRKSGPADPAKDQIDLVQAFKAYILGEPPGNKHEIDDPSRKMIDRHGDDGDQFQSTSA